MRIGIWFGGLCLGKEEQVFRRGCLGGPGGTQSAAASAKAGEGGRILIPGGHKAESSRRDGWLAGGGFDAAAREKALETGKIFLAAKMADGPENQAENDTYDDRTGERKGYGPAPSLPGEVTRKSSQGDVHALEKEKDSAHDHQEKTETDQNASEI